MPQKHDDPDRVRLDEPEPTDEAAEPAQPAQESPSDRAATKADKVVSAPKPRARSISPDRTVADAAAGRARSGTLRTVLATVVVVALVVVSVLLYLQTRALDSERQAAADRARAEQIASAYAVKSATMDYRDLTPWLNAVKAGTTPELAKKFDSIVDLIREVVTPLRLTSTGKASFATTTSEVNGIYEVKVAVDISTQNIQTPQGSDNTSVYSISIDKNRDWVITATGDPVTGSVLRGAPATSASASATPSQAATPTMPVLPELPTTPAPSSTPN